MRPGTRRPRIWLLACLWCLLVWTASAKASWEAYQQAGEAAYSRGDYSTARRMFLAAVREAKHFGPQDPRLDISLNKLALLRVMRSPHSRRGGQAQYAVRKKHHTRKHSAVRRGRQRHASRTVLRRAKPGRQHHALLPRRPGEHRRGPRTRIARQTHRTKRPRTVLHHARPTRHAAPLAHHGKRHGVTRTSRLHRGHTRQRPHTTLHRARPQRPGHTPRAVRPDRRRKGVRSGRRAMLLAPHATPALATIARPPWLATDLVT